MADKEPLHVRINARLKARLREVVDANPRWRSMTHFVEVALDREIEQVKSKDGE